MLTISQQQAGQRWDAITPRLREALFSDVNADFVWNLCQNEHLTEEKSYQVAEISGYVFLGFLHPEDLAGEIVSSVDLPAPLAKTISDQINSRVFAPLRADIDKVYSPLSKLGSSPMGSAPKHDIAPSNIIPSTPKPTTLSDIGWSKQPAAAAKIVVNAAIPVSTPTPIPSRSPQAPPPKPAAEPAPMMLHEDTTFKPAEKNVSFTLSKPGGAAEMNMNRGSVPQTPIRPAVLEFGGATTTGTSVPKPPAATSNSTRPMGFGPSLASMPTTDMGTRNVSRIMPSVIPKPPASMPTPPRPPQTPPRTPSLQIPQPPKPPAPPQAPQNSPTAPQPNKPIVKDFL
jgi:hypothetical protein